MVLKLYGHPLLVNAHRVIVVLHEKQVPFVFHLIDMPKREHKSVDYLNKQPFGQVPYIDDDGFILYESRAICHYIEAKYPDQGTSLIPKDLQANALYQQAASTEVFAFDEPAAKLVRETFYKPLWGQTIDQAIVDSSLTSLSAKLNVYDEILSKQKYLAGEDITLADLYHLPYADLLPLASANIIQERPNVARWYKEVSSRPSWQKVKDFAQSTTWNTVN
ncbi:glutathione S-transferase [Agrocybe pediades]|nr:glutathione S-transferase [Agrocybe pediades]